MFDEFDVGKTTSFGRAVHSSLYPEKYMDVDDFWSDVILFHDII